MALTKIQDRIIEPGGVGEASLKREPVIYFNTVFSSNANIEANVNGLSVGPVTFESNVTLTIASGQRWIVI